jgi:hypothetical protein
MDRPAPLIAPEVNMGGDEWFPWYFHRIRKSKWWRRATDLARARNIMLWGEAYQQTPAGSLADDDDELAEAAGFGFDVDAFGDHKAEIMAPWVLCADGRWYHPTLCEVALESWARKSDRRKKAAERKREQRDRVRGVTRDMPEPETTVTADIEDVTRDIAIQTDSTDRQIEDADASLSLVGENEDDQPEKIPYPPDFEAVWKAYPHSKGRSSKSKSHGVWRRLSKARRKALPSAVARYAREGREPKVECGAPAMERWLGRDLDLNWHDDPASDAPEAPPWPGPAELRAAIASAQGEGFARSYLDPSGWRNGPDRMVLCRNEIAAKKLNAEVSEVLRRFDAQAVVERAA